MGQYISQVNGCTYLCEVPKKRKKKKVPSKKEKILGGISGLVKQTEYPDSAWRKECTFLVVMNRNGTPEEHTYPLAVYSTLNTAIHNAHKEVCQRAGMYSAWIYVNKHKVNDSEKRLTLIYIIQSRKELTQNKGIENKKSSIKKLVEKIPAKQRLMFEISYYAKELEYLTKQLNKKTTK